jgi:hypothetical protein
MRKLFYISGLLISAVGFAQNGTSNKYVNDSLKVGGRDSVRTVYHPVHQSNNEFGGNLTLFIKQVFSLSNNTFVTLPYDITYKHLCGKYAFRAGFGILLNNTSVSTTTSITSSNGNPNVPPAGPDQTVPTTNKSTNTFFRVGIERRHMFDSRICAYWGVDLAGQLGESYSASSVTSNNLPNNYSFSKTSDMIQTMAIGGGPVGGIQLYLTKSLSLFTEVPLYFMYNYQKEVTDNFQNFLTAPQANYYVQSENKQTVITKGPKFSVTLPVTLYLAIKF